MLFDGDELRRIVDQTPNTIELRNEFGRCCRALSSEEAAALDLSLFIGIGNARRIRFLRPRSQRFQLNSGSLTRRRITGSDAKVIAHPLIREHRTVHGGNAQ